MRMTEKMTMIITMMMATTMITMLTLTMIIIMTKNCHDLMMMTMRMRTILTMKSEHFTREIWGSAGRSGWNRRRIWYIHVEVTEPEGK